LQHFVLHLIKYSITNNSKKNNTFCEYNFYANIVKA